MAYWSVAIAGLFFPLFPFSMFFNALLRRLGGPLLRALLILGWPQAGVLALSAMQGDVPGWVTTWAVATAALYALRAVAVRDVLIWAGFLASSAWALLWISAAAGLDHAMLSVHALAFSIPLVLLVFLADGLKRRYGGAYAGVVSGLARTVPRLSALVALVVLAVVAMPLSPGFAVLLSMVVATVPVLQGVALMVLAVWLGWSWAAAQLLQALLVGDGGEGRVADYSPGATGLYGALLVVLLAFGIWLVGVLG